MEANSVPEGDLLLAADWGVTVGERFAVWSLKLGFFAAWGFELGIFPLLSFQTFAVLKPPGARRLRAPPIKNFRGGGGRLNRPAGS